MKRAFHAFALLCLLGVPIRAFAQGNPGNPYLGTVTALSAPPAGVTADPYLGTVFIVNALPNGLLSARPVSNCVLGQEYYATDNTTLYISSTSPSCTWNSLTGGSGTPGGATNAVQYNNAGALGGCTPPTVNGLYNLVYNVTGSASVAPTCNALPGIPVLTPSTPYTQLYSDRATFQRLAGGTTFSFQLMQITGNGASNYPFAIFNGNSGNLTLTANAADKINNSSTGGTYTVPAGWLAYVYQDSSSAPGNWWPESVPTLSAIPTCGDGTHALSGSPTTGFGCQTLSGGAGSSQLDNQAPQTSFTTGNAAVQNMYTTTLASGLAAGACVTLKSASTSNGVGTYDVYLLIGATQIDLYTLGAGNNPSYAILLCNNPGVQNAQYWMFEGGFLSGINTYNGTTAINFATSQTIGFGGHVAATGAWKGLGYQVEAQ